MIGFFDSGFGGLTIMREVVKLLPDHSYIYLGDNARAPYGSRSREVIYQYTCEGVDELFRRGAKLVVLACNTSSAVALGRLQREYLPKTHPGKKVLGIIIPTAEEAGSSGARSIGIFATEATVESKAFETEALKKNSGIRVVQHACPLLVPIIESGEWDLLDSEIEKYSRVLFSKGEDIEAIILGCTHYALVEEIFSKHVPEGVEIISQGRIVAEKLQEYLECQTGICSRLSKEGGRTFLTTENSSHVQHLAEVFYGEKIELQIAVISNL
jgi:glutamate racemase